MASSWAPSLRAAVAVAVACAATAVTVGLFLTVPGGSVCGSGGSALTCSPGGAALHYVSEDVTVPDTGNVSNVSFEDFAFSLWSAWGGVQGTATEPDGLTFDLFLEMPGTAEPGAPVNPAAGPSDWSSPDGAVQVIGLGSIDGGFGIELEVASPSAVYGAHALVLTPENATRSFAATELVQGVLIEAVVGELTASAGGFLDVNATEPNGTSVSLHVWDGPLLACAVPDPTLGALLDRGSCLYAGDPPEGVAVLWDGEYAVTVLVREA